MCDTSGPNTGSIISLNAIGKQDTYLIENDQTKSFLNISEIFLKDDGIGLLSLKAASERWIEGGDDSRFELAKELIESNSRLTLIDNVDISYYEGQHRVFIVKK